MAGYVADSIHRPAAKLPCCHPLTISSPLHPLPPTTRLGDKATKPFFSFPSFLFVLPKTCCLCIKYSELPHLLPLSQQSSCKRSNCATIFSLLRKPLLGVVARAANSPIEICHTQTASTRLMTPTWSRLVTSSVPPMGTLLIETILKMCWSRTHRWRLTPIRPSQKHERLEKRPQPVPRITLQAGQPRQRRQRHLSYA
jgi:hypothetical protein